MSNNPVTLEQLTLETAEAAKQQLRQNAEVKQIADQINIKNQLDLMALGKGPATKLSHFSDQILNMITQSKANESSDLLKQLEVLMSKFDKKEVIEQKGFFRKLFKREEKKEEDLFAKYNILGRDIEKIHYQFVLMEEALAKDNRMLARLYNEDLMYYLDLEKYIVAAELKLHEVSTTLIPMYEKQSEAGNQIARMELNSLQTIAELLEQKIEELEKSRMVAILAAPQIEMLRYGNSELMEQINNAFVTTIPVFKMGIMNAVNEKRQKLQNDSVAAFEKRMKQFGGVSNETVELSTAMAQQTETTQTLEEIWDTIVLGIANYRKLRDEQIVQHKQAEKKLMALRN
ncbi:tellurite resistance protein [Lysinibacillus sp. FJAT-14745]|uniref:toxic anion resistance protein n=1 Tax=Lysinibacillus sp. FJAT-14745 TaxID=1704289 RepID=UPI0006AB8C31|nr:toxic anion resistance protein [Lysinibacillus sp. FJAT-14745]KOP79549.1 tellurite resistance protein [Lysinibacillus sp. FJAT-14745]